ncbi:hypothetical protein [Paraburkholderia hayleyella]|uniref:hypothetical protein n=1 Tax=Paraburkholderia hayleyella TaxID=2152889 RepID=UPI0012928285|nr:hypothetical protein [Paraburkholderia hayleyella]
MITTLNNDWRDPAIDCLTRQFCEAEPLTACLNVPKNDFKKFVSPIVDQAIEAKLSTIAISPKNEFVGIVIAHDYSIPLAMPDKIPDSMAPIVELLDQISHSIEQPALGADKILHIFTAAMEPGNSSESQKLFDAQIRIAQQHKFEMMFTEATNPLSQQFLIRRYGWHEIACNKKIYYKYFSFAGSRPFEKLNPKMYCKVLGSRLSINH